MIIIGNTDISKIIAPPVFLIMLTKIKEIHITIK